jgi:hypothetical protein
MSSMLPRQRPVSVSPRLDEVLELAHVGPDPHFVDLKDGPGFSPNVSGAYFNRTGILLFVSSSPVRATTPESTLRQAVRSPGCWSTFHPLLSPVCSY